MSNFFKKLFNKKDFGGSMVVCSKCGSKHVSVTTCVSEENRSENGIKYNVFTYGVRCTDCGAVGVFTEKWEQEVDDTNKRVYVTLVDDPTKVSCPNCGCHELIPSEESGYDHKIDENYNLYVCKKCNVPVCATKKDNK